MAKETLSSLLKESRRFDPPPELSAHANVTADVYAQAARDCSRGCGVAGAATPQPRDYAGGMPPGIMILYGACLAGDDGRGR